MGDCFEEHPDVAVALAQQLRLKGVRVFVFHDMTSQQQGYDVAAARAVYAVGGLKLLAAQQRALPAARRLLDQLRP